MEINSQDKNFKGDGITHLIRTKFKHGTKGCNNVYYNYQ